jgi:hypothetical protein
VERKVQLVHLPVVEVEIKILILLQVLVEVVEPLQAVLGLITML